MPYINAALHPSSSSTVTTAEAAEMLHLKVTTVRAYAREGLLKSVRLGKSSIISLASLDRLKRIGTKAARNYLRWQSDERGRNGVDLEGDVALTARRAAELADLAKLRLSDARNQSLTTLETETRREEQRQHEANQQMEALTDRQRMHIQARIGADLVHKSIGEMDDIELIRLSSTLQRALSGVQMEQALPPAPPPPIHLDPNLLG